jgi:hypothetical protein
VDVEPDVVPLLPQEQEAFEEEVLAVESSPADSFMEEYDEDTMQIEVVLEEEVAPKVEAKPSVFQSVWNFFFGWL